MEVGQRLEFEEAARQEREDEMNELEALSQEHQQLQEQEENGASLKAPLDPQARKPPSPKIEENLNERRNYGTVLSAHCLNPPTIKSSILTSISASLARPLKTYSSPHRLQRRPCS